VSNSVSTSGNATPNAAFSASTSGLTATLDASTSTDPDGTVASYAWTFGDGTSGTGRTASHAYTAAGTYPVSLTVTDNAGLTSTVTKSVTVASPAPAGSIAADSFRRTLATGWGAADLGGTWTTTGAGSLYGVGNGAGVIRLNAAGSGPATQLAIGSTDTALRFNFSFDKDPTGGGQQVRAIVRGTAANGYQAKVTANSAKAMSLALTKVVGGTATDLGSVTLPLTFVAGATYSIQVQAWGTGTTNLQARVWRSDSAEPATWALSRTDTTAELQVAGGIGVGAYLSGSATSAPVVLTVSGLSAGRAVR
jgi:PKD repeat protein